jgi:hypothetical protein
MIRLYLWFYRVLFVAREPWVRWAPGLPCALVLSRATTMASARGAQSPPAGADVYPQLSPLFDIQIEPTRKSNNAATRIAHSIVCLLRVPLVRGRSL